MLNSRSVPRLAPLAAAVAIAFSTAALAQVMPQGGTVKAGAATITNTSASRMDINQASQRAVVDWNSFSIGQGGHVNVNQPAGGAMLSRVVGTDPSQIFGQLTANGLFALVNPNGIVFGPTARIDVGSLIASTANISTDNFMAGRYVFDQAINRNAAIVNQGEINAAEGGLVALVAPGVANSGTIRANLGRVALASGHAYTLDLFGDQLVSFAVNDKVTERVTDINGTPLRAFVDQSGRIEAEKITISANAAKAVLDNVINMSGVLKARGVAQRGGEIVLTGEDIHVTSTGVIDVSGTTGGRAALVADGHMQFDGIVDARGSAGPGGFVEVSGKQTLGYSGDVLLSAGGSLLFDPTELDINAAMATTLSNTMFSGATATATTSSGDLVVSSVIDGRGGTAGGGLTLSAGGTGSVLINKDILANNGTVNITAGGAITMAASGSSVTSGATLVYAGNGTIMLAGAAGVTAQHLLTTGAVNISSSGGAVTLAQNLGGSLGAGLGSLSVSSAGNVVLKAIQSAGTVNVTAANSRSITVDGAISASGNITLGNSAGAGGAANTDILLRHSLFATNGNITLNGVGKVNPAGDELLTQQAGGPVFYVSNSTQTADAQFSASGVAPTITAGAAPTRWDGINPTLTLRTTGSGNVVANGGLLWDGATAVTMFHYFKGFDGANRATVATAPARRFLVMIDSAGGVTLNGTLGYAPSGSGLYSFRSANNNYLDNPSYTTALNGGVAVTDGRYPGTDNTFQMYIKLPSGTVAATTATGVVDTLVVNVGGVATTVTTGNQVANGFTGLNADSFSFNSFVSLPSPPGGAFSTPSPTNVSGSTFFLSEVALPGTNLAGATATSAASASAGTSAAATGATTGATQEASAAGNNAANQTVREGASGESGGTRGPAQSADLRGAGSTVDVFGQTFSVADGRGAGPNADGEYFTQSPFDQARRRATGQ